DRGQDADDHHDDQQLDQREPLTSLDHVPVLSLVEATLQGRGPEVATPVPGSARRGRCGSCHYITMTWRIARSPDGVRESGSNRCVLQSAGRIRRVAGSASRAAARRPGSAGGAPPRGPTGPAPPLAPRLPAAPPP